MGRMGRKSKGTFNHATHARNNLLTADARDKQSRATQQVGKNVKRKGRQRSGSRSTRIAMALTEGIISSRAGKLCGCDAETDRDG